MVTTTWSHSNQTQGKRQIKVKLGQNISYFNDIIQNRVHMLAKAKQGNPARDEVIDLTDEEIELLSKQFLLLHSFCSRFVNFSTLTDTPLK